MIKLSKVKRIQLNCSIRQIKEYCEAESFRFVIEQAVAYIYDQEGYADTDSEACKLFEEA